MSCGLVVVSGSAMHEKLLFGAARDDSRRFWLFSEQAHEMQFRTPDSGGLDKVDRLLLQLEAERQGQVFDTWFMPWLCHTRPLRFWLEVPHEERVRRLAGASDLNQSSLRSLDNAVRAKDERARRHGMELYGIDLFTDREPFDVIVGYQESTRPEVVTAIVRAIVGASLGMTPNFLNCVAPNELEALRRCPHIIWERLWEQVSGR